MTRPDVDFSTDETASLTQALDAFSRNPSKGTAGRLLIVGLTYWHDTMIEDSTFDNDVVKPVADWLIAQEAP